MPASLRAWLLVAGYGDIDDEISFREDWFASIEGGQLKGGGTFAQDALGNMYAFDATGQIYYLCRSEPVYAAMSSDFSTFLEELVRRDYKLGEWVDSVETRQYDWS